MFTKKDLEDRELNWCQPYALLSKNSQGRSYPEQPDNFRTEFQRDRDRVIHSKAFRRLKHKTQVFVATAEGDHYRTRLSHTLEVAQIARHISRVLGVNEDLTETIALAHDLGHTPFGHAGETALDECMKNHGGFEHNRQSKKIVEKLEKKYLDFNGLNLTYELLDGLIKHRSPYDHPDQNQTSPSLEAQVANIADEIAYNSHDLDDGLTSGLIKAADANKIPLWKNISETHKLQHPNITPAQLHGLNIRHLIHLQVNDVLQETERRLQQYNIKSAEDVSNCTATLVDYSPEFSEQIKTLRAFLYKYFYAHPKIVAKNKKASKIISTLFAYFVKTPKAAKESSMYLSESTPQEAACDFIAGMTDQYAMNVYRKIK